MALVYIDTCIFIAAFEGAGPAATATGRLLAALEGRARAVTSEMTLAELLAPISREARSTTLRRAMYMPLLEDEAFIRLAPVTRDILIETSTLRSSFPQRLPDAIHITTALRHDCRYLVSSDRDAKRVPPFLTWVTPFRGEIDTLIQTLDA